MKRLTLPIAALSIMFVGVPIVAAAQRGSPDRKVVRKYISWALPASQELAERLADVDSVLRIRLLGKLGARAVPSQEAQPRGRLSNLSLEGLPHVLTEYSVEVLDVVKPHPLAGAGGAQTTIARLGGEVDWLSDHRLVVLEDGPLLIQGSEYVVLLQYRQDVNALVVSPWDAFRVNAGTIEADTFQPQTRYGAELVGRTPTEAVAAIRAVLDVNR